jgi:hypothetical protein
MKRRIGAPCLGVLQPSHGKSSQSGELVGDWSGTPLTRARLSSAKSLTSAGAANGDDEIDASAIILRATQQTVYGVVEFTSAKNAFGVH